MSIRSILVGVDGRERSSRALAFGAGLAQRESAELAVCHVRPRISWQTLVLASLPTIPPVPWETATAADAAYDAIAQEVSAEATAAFGAVGVDGRTYLRTGDIVTEIARLADERHVDLIVIGRPRRLRSRSAVVTRRLTHGFAHGLFIAP